MAAIKTYLGCSSFYNSRWKGVFYPDALASGNWFEFYCEHFNSFEINATFYKFPTLKILDNWYKKSPDGFVYAVKAPKVITHISKFVDCKGEIDRFYSLCKEGLRDKLGCILFQLPPSFQFSAEKLELIVGSLNPDFKTAVEFRHSSWWRDEVFERLGKNNISFCSVSHPSLPDAVVATTKVGYVRLHGCPEMFYSEYSHDYLVKLQQEIIGKGVFEEVFVYFNNTASSAGVLNALELERLFDLK